MLSHSSGLIAESFSYGLNRIIRVNGDEIDADAGISYEISEKIADNKIRTYDIIKMDSIPEKFTIDIDFVKTYETEELSSEQAALEDAVFKEHDETTAGDMVEEYVEEPEEDIDYEIEEIDEEPEELEMEEIDPILDIELLMEPKKKLKKMLK